MAPRKRGREEMEQSGPEPAHEPTMLDRLRNTWELANLMQYIFLFGKAVKIDEDLDIDDLEQECLKPEKSHVLNEIGLALLKFVSSHRGLTMELFDEYTRRQYLAKAPQRNPFGEEEIAKKFTDFDVFLRLKVLVQLSQWTFMNPDRMREKMPDVKESEQTLWRIEEIGWDRHERSYFVLDDNRLYRRTDPPPPPPPVYKSKPKANSKKAKAAARASRRRRAAGLEEAGEDADVDTGAENFDNVENAENGEKAVDDNGDGFGGLKWECIAVSLGQYQDFLASIQKSRDPEEKALHKRITETVLPEIEKAEASHLRKKQKQERELLNLQKLATAKRSSRLEAKFERERQEQEAAEVERKRKEELAAAKRDQEKQKAMEAARESRMMTREQRLKDREYKRLLHEEELANLSEENKKIEAGESQRSERHLKAEMEKKKKDLAALVEEEDWVFDCAKCGIYGNNLDDGSPSIACERCNVWQHTACLGFTQEEAEKDDFHFVCSDCKRREEDAKKPKIPTLKFHLGSSSSPPQSQSKLAHPVVNGTAVNGVKRKPKDGALPPSKKFKSHEHQPGGVPRPAHAHQNGMHEILINGPQLSPQGQLKTSLSVSKGSPSPSSKSVARSPGPTNQGVSSVWRLPSYEFTSGSPNTSKGNNQGQARESKNPGPQANSQPYPFSTPYGFQNPPPSYHRYPNPASSPVSQHSNKAYPNGYMYQTSQINYQQHPTGYPTQNGTHSDHQTQGAYGEANGPPPSNWSAQNPHPHSHSHSPSKKSQNLPAYVSSPPLHQNQDKGASQRSLIGARQPSNTSSTTPSTSSNSYPNTQERSFSLHAASSHKDHSSTNQNAQPSSPHYSAPILTPGPQNHKIPAANGYKYDPVPPTQPSTHSPVKQASPPTSFTHPPPASSPITNQPPLQPTHAPTSPGFSPQKKRSPTPPPQLQLHSAQAQYNIHNNASPAAAAAAPAPPPTTLPPGPKLSPSPTQTPAVAPHKHEMPGHGDIAREKNAHASAVAASAPILSPGSAPLREVLVSPTKGAALQTQIQVDSPTAKLPEEPAEKSVQAGVEIEGGGEGGRS